MSLREICLAATSETDELPLDKPKSQGDDIADALQSQIINAFEAAIYQGMRPVDALAIILTWMSSEMTRIQAEHANRSSW
jgi:hypothetical protein